MTSLASQIEGALNSLRTALQQNLPQAIDRTEADVRDLLLSNDTYRSMGDERLLAQAEQLLNEALGNAADADLYGLRAHLVDVRRAHHNLYAVLDYENDLGALLLGPLANWSILSESLQFNFPDMTKGLLHQARISGNSEQRLESFLELFIKALEDQGLHESASQIEPLIVQAIEGYQRLREWQVFALFALGARGDVYGVKVRTLANGDGTVRSLNSTGIDMKTAATKAVSFVTSSRPQTRQWDFHWEISRNDIEFDGESIGLSLAIATIARIENIDIDLYTAFTGKVESDGTVRRIEYLPAKLQAAKQLGIRRVFIPLENIEDCEGIDGVKLIPVESVDEALHKLKSATYYIENTNLKALAQNKIQEIEISVKANGIYKVRQDDQSNSCIRVEFTDRRDTAFLLVYHTQQISPVVQGKESPLKRNLEAARDRVFGSKVPAPSDGSPKKQSTQKYVVKESELQHRLLRHLQQRGDGIQEKENNCVYRMRITKGGQTTYVRQFTSGTLTVSGISPLLDEIDADVRAIIGMADDNVPQALQDSSIEAQIKAVQSVELGESWIGTDEAGKGDYYGPLVAAAVFINQHLASELEKIGVKDSKTLSDKRNIELAESIRRICGKRAQVVVIPPERYNTLYEQFQREGKNLNTLLAWGHTRALEDILTEYPQEQITVIVDKFGDEHFVRNKLLSKSRQTKLNLVQLPKAEANIAVAAASILARAQFLQSLARISAQYKIDFPKGASDSRILTVGKQIIARFGNDELRNIAKVHFSTTRKILS
jgi:ribonuclease HIII